MKNTFWVHNIFPTPLIHINFSKHKKFSFNFEKIKNKTNKPKNWLNEVYTSFPNISEKDKCIRNQDLKKLKKNIKEDIDVVFNELNIPTLYSMDELWYNVYNQNQSQESHSHLSELNKKNPYWSGVYYYKNCTPTIFLREDNLPLLQNFSVNMDSKLKHFYFMEYAPDVKDGDIVLFPSYLKHKTNINNNKELKVTFSFNLYLK